jgi:hypothetical protein
MEHGLWTWEFLGVVEGRHPLISLYLIWALEMVYTIYLKSTYHHSHQQKKIKESPPNGGESTSKTEARVRGHWILRSSRGHLGQLSSSTWRWSQGSRWGMQVCVTFPVFADGTGLSLLTVQNPSVWISQIHSSAVIHGVCLTHECEGHIGPILTYHKSEKVLSW